MMEKDPLGNALLDYYHQPDDALELIVKSPDFKDDVISVKHFFRDYDDMPKIEKLAISECSGSILDVGSGAGCHSMALQNQGFHVTALEASPGAINVLIKRGINNIIHQNIYQVKNKKFDTILMLMNGIGIAGTPAGAETLLLHMKSLLQPDGRIIFDSSDLIYLFDGRSDDINRELDVNYYGIVQYQMQYKKTEGEPFYWLYLDEQGLITLARKTGYTVEILYRDRHYAYLAKLAIKQ